MAWPSAPKRAGSTADDGMWCPGTAGGKGCRGGTIVKGFNRQQAKAHISICSHYAVFTLAQRDSTRLGCVAQPMQAWLVLRVQCTVAVRVTVQASRKQFPSNSTLPFLPGLGVGGPLVIFCLSGFVSASAVRTVVQPLLAPCLWVV